ncbi:YHS domain-containing protein [Chryseobacterium ginsenosidimutans]|jgi:YHS domain-containing protein|uniref:YHS domain-containing protein n=1 Tax=Chryseobacterium ginsenosidimutans TaxID=687846 RepID=UPI00216A32F8|nr:YHS domain-containing protein [Chryseobacterium ginsenosidimutans]MCS3867895.1 YHS domain-containing protein [Chryseobacterium ginsenosidimutans]
MKSKIILTALLSVSLMACAQETPKVKHKKSTAASKSNIKKVKFANAEDPICHMPTESDMKDTAVYKNKTYGFCSVYCKDEFKKDPEKYVQK